MRIGLTGQMVGGDTYEQVSYLQSDGNQYIDTGLVGNFTGSISLNMNVIGTSRTSYYKYLGAVYTDTDRLLIYNAQTAGFRGDFGSGDGYYDVHLSGQNITLTKRAIKLNPLSNAHIILFNCQYNKGTIGYSQATRIMSCSFYDSNDVALRNFTPCLKNGTEAGLFDSVENKFYGNASGVGDFTYG